MNNILKIVVFAALVLFIAGGLWLGYNRYELYERDKLISLATEEMEYFSNSNPNRTVNLKEDIKRLVKARNFHINAENYGADPNSQLRKNIDEHLRVYMLLAAEQAKREAKKNPISQVDKFWSQFDKALDKLNKARKANDSK